MANFKMYGFKNVEAKPYKIEMLIKIVHDVIMGEREGDIMCGNHQESLNVTRV